jgi:hypothetical protein
MFFWAGVGPRVDFAIFGLIMAWKLVISCARTLAGLAEGFYTAQGFDADLSLQR